MSVKKVNKTTGSTTKVAGLVNSEKVNTMYGAFPSDASASNKLVSDSTANEKISDESQVIFEVMGEMGAKNLLPVTVAEIKKNNTSNGAWNGNVFTTTGGKITFTINTTDGVTVDSIRVQTNPSGTGVTAYAFYVFNGSKKLTAPTIYTPISNNDAVSPPFSCACTVDGTNYAVNNGAKYKDLPAGTLTKSWIYSESGSTVDKTFYPMIRLASIEDDTYEPYAKTNQELTKETIGLIDNDFANGAVNLLPLITYSNRQFGDATNGYITVNSNADGSFTLNGSRISTASVLLIPIIKDGKYLLTDNIIKRGKSYKYTACPSNSASQHLLSQINYRDGSNNLVQYEEGGNGVTINIPIDATVGNCNIAVYHDANFSNVVVKPMITLASTPNSDYNHYVPYAKSNKELTEALTVSKGAPTANTDYIASSDLHYEKYGKVVHVFGNFETNTAILGTDSLVTLFTNLPNSNGGMNGTSSQYTLCLLHDNTNDGLSYRCFVSNEGKLVSRYKAIPIGTYFADFTYICQ